MQFFFLIQTVKMDDIKTPAQKKKSKSKVNNVQGKIVRKRKFKQWWSTIPQIWLQWTITSHLNWTQQWTKIYDVRNLGPGLEHPHKCGGVKLVPCLSSYYITFCDWFAQYCPIIFFSSWKMNIN